MEEVRQGGRGTAAANEANEAPKEPPAETKEKAQAAAATDKAAAEKAAAEQAAAAKAAADAKVLLRENTRLCECVCVIPVCVCVCVCVVRIDANSPLSHPRIAIQPTVKHLAKINSFPVTNAK